MNKTIKSQYKEKCDICGQPSNKFQFHNDMLVCDKCMAQHHGRFELAEPKQIDMFSLANGLYDK